MKKKFEIQIHENNCDILYIFQNPLSIVVTWNMLMLCGFKEFLPFKLVQFGRSKNSNLSSQQFEGLASDTSQEFCNIEKNKPNRSRRNSKHYRRYRSLAWKY